jgi:hypothetical protein
MTVDKDSPVRGALGKKTPTVAVPKGQDALYSRVFNTRDGKAVLADLNKKYYDNEISESDINREVGRRDVLRFINRRVTPHE